MDAAVAAARAEGFADASVEFLTVAALEATSHHDPRYAKGYTDALNESSDWTEQDYFKAGVKAARDAVEAFLYSVDDDVEAILAAIDGVKP